MHIVESSQCSFSRTQEGQRSVSGLIYHINDRVNFYGKKSQQHCVVCSYSIETGNLLFNKDASLQNSISTSPVLPAKLVLRIETISYLDKGLLRVMYKFFVSAHLVDVSIFHLIHH